MAQQEDHTLWGCMLPLDRDVCMSTEVYTMAVKKAIAAASGLVSSRQPFSGQVEPTKEPWQTTDWATPAA
jgi:hypothetical protein